MNKNYQKYREHLQKIADINGAMSLMHWDQEVYMPDNGVEFRSRQMATLAGMAHELKVDSEFGNLLEKLSSDSSLKDHEKLNINESLRQYNKQIKYTTEFIQTLSRTTSEAFQAWQSAKRNNDFSRYAPVLEKMVDLKKDETKIIGFEDHPYDALLDEYEPGVRTRDLDILFSDVRNKLVDFVKTITDQEEHSDAILYSAFNKGKLWQFSLDILKQMGYDFNSGRQDISEHPFTITINPKDVRVTTWLRDNNIADTIWSSIHEGGHALYEQGLPDGEYGLPAGEAASLSIHESQSRIWENNVGRKIHYWKSNYPILREYFPQQLKGIDLNDFYKAMNVVKPSLIRTSADELTYHFHVLVRYEIEKSLIEGTLEINELPGYWNEKYREYLGIDVPSDQEGVLQDVHWSHGSFGYFPTYSLGSFYAAQFYSQALQDIPDMEEQISSGNMKPLLGWLRENIHQYGKLYNSDELCKKITGEGLNFDYFMNYATEKYSGIYQISDVLKPTET